VISQINDCVPLRSDYSNRLLNSEYIKQALAKVGNPNVLVNLISRRVRQLASGGGSSWPLIDQTATTGLADVALLEIIHGKMGYSMSTRTEEEEEVETSRKKRRRT